MRFLLTMAMVLTLAATAAAQPPAARSATPLEIARTQFDAGHYGQAVDLLLSASRMNPADAALQFWLARSYFELRDWNRAVESAERAVKLDPANSVYHDWLGRAYGRKAEHSNWFSALSLAGKTRREFEEAVRLDPKNFAAQRDLIDFYYSAPGIVGGGDDKAESQIRQLAALNPVEGHLAWADYLMDKKRPEQAEAEYRKAIEAKPKEAGPYLDAAGFYIGQDKTSEALKAVDLAAAVDSGDRRISYYRGAALVLANRDAAVAERSLKTYLTEVPQRSDFPSHAAAHTWLGLLYERQGKRAEAVAEYQAALRIDPKSKAARGALKRLGK